MIPILNRFYSENRLAPRIDEDNILGFRYEIGMSGVNKVTDKFMKFDHLDTILRTHNVKKENILFLDDNPETIQGAINHYDLKNSVIIDGIDDILAKLNLFIIEKQIPVRELQSGGAKDIIRKSLRNNKNMIKNRKSLVNNKNIRKIKKSLRNN